ncbi:relaxase/mobilization nuclease domain-containing protein [Leisingera sp. D0M16]|uniref:relaxase/mobilization nuclease domain-containing protein n=1 Tax=Leisingera coralii TaxID=3351347 RepID=UPI003B7ADC2C
MILKAKERGDAPQLARYLLATRDNDHVELHEVRGFVSDNLLEAFHEADAIARGTRCRNYLFSMSLNPPEGAQVSTGAFERAADRIERKLGLEGQPRVIVFHERDGRRHAHVVWSRIDTQRMRAINLPHFKFRLRDLSRKLYLEHGWDMPPGLQDCRFRDPLSFTRAEWQQARRAGLDPREIKTVLRQCWKVSDSRASLERALKERGFWLARGDRRGFVAIDYRGEVYSLSRHAGVTTKKLENRIGDRNRLRSVDEIRNEIARGMSRKLAAFIRQTERDARQRIELADFRKAGMTARHRDKRAELWARHEQRWQAETRERAQRLPRGISGIWHRLTGRYARVKAQNEQEALQAWQRDRTEKDGLIHRQLDERQSLQRDIRMQRELARQELMQLRADVANYREIGHRERVQKQRRDKDDGARRRRQSRRRRDFEP